MMRWILLTAVLAGTAARALGAENAPSADAVEFFERKIRPVLVEQCYECHSAGAKKVKGGLLLDTKAGVLKGGESGEPSVVSGQVERSLLIKAIRYQDDVLAMPPKKKLPDAVIADFVRWVEMGAPDPRTGEATVKTQAKVEGHWAFERVHEVKVPEVKNSAWAKTAMDRFVLAKLEEKGIVPSAPADRRTLIRRATYDLTGLPPTLDEIEAFERDPSADAFEKVVDRLLASPRYGERWGRYWLDLARYSDTKGYVYDREERFFVFAHTYRDWVIRAFNDDLPYDRFVKLQLAADQIVGYRPIRQGDLEAVGHADLAALGFLTVGRRFLGIAHEIIDDRIDVVSRTMQGLTVACARCHDHKFDPIPTQDYYSLYGVFQNTFEKNVPLAGIMDGTVGEEYAAELTRRVEKFDSEFAKKKEELAERVKSQSVQYFAALTEVEKLRSEEFYETVYEDDVNPLIVRQWQTYIFLTRSGFHPIFTPWNELMLLPKNEFQQRASSVVAKVLGEYGERLNPRVAHALVSSPPKTRAEVGKMYGELFAKAHSQWREAVKKQKDVQRLDDSALEEFRQILYAADSPVNVPKGSIQEVEPFFTEGVRDYLAKLQKEIDSWNIKSDGAPPHAGILEDTDKIVNARVFRRGNPANRGEEVPRRFLEIVSGKDRKAFTKGAGRLEMAEAIASKENPLTARVMVNRVWGWHFGQPIVGTTSDFGVRAEPPSHPALLDYLAGEFMNSGWSIKRLHKLIMLSSVYQQSSQDNETGYAVDPTNKLLWKFNRQRLDFEAMRDSLLLASGELDLKTGGKPEEMFKAGYTKRRTVYGLVDRQFLPGTFRVFDFANPDLHIPQRPSTTVPQQALYFMNSSFIADRAKGVLARPELKGASDARQRVKRMYEAVYRRAPTERQVEMGLKFVESVGPEAPAPKPKPVSKAWSYGYGEFDEKSQRMSFKALPHFTGDAWQGGPAWPDGKLGWVQIKADGGHAGNDLKHAAIRRWTAEKDMSVSISGAVQHPFAQGDGIQARVVSSRQGQIAFFALYDSKAEVNAGPIEVKMGETIDFVVDLRGNLNNDEFRWSPVVKEANKAEAAKVAEWDAKKEFGGGAVTPPAPPLNAWERLAQVLLLSNEFVFVD